MMFALLSLLGLAISTAVMPDPLAAGVATAEPVCQHTIGLEVRKADGSSNYSAVQPGDTVCIEAGTREPLQLQNFHGEPDMPITLVNSGGVVTILGNNFAGVLFSNSEHLRLTGTGVSTQCGSPFLAEDQECGIRILGAQRGVAGRDRTGYIEVDHLEIANGSKSGITINTDAPRDEWTQYDTYVHHNYVHDMGTEGMYIGGSHYRDGAEPVLKGVDVSYNLVTMTGWDGIQVGSAVEGCTIHHNEISNDSQAYEPNQRSGIMENPGSACDIYSNSITDSTASAIYVQGNGGTTVHDNVIVRPGRMETKGAHAGSGIIVGTSSSPEPGMTIQDNLIVEPNGDGIRFTNREGAGHTVQRNTVVDPGGTCVSVNREANVTVSDNLQRRNGQESGQCEATR